MLALRPFGPPLAARAARYWLASLAWSPLPAREGHIKPQNEALACTVVGSRVARHVR